MRYRTWLEIDEKALSHNLKEIRKIIGKNVRLMAVVKSNAYGHGLIKTAKLIEKHQLADWFGVDSLSEALLLRQHKIKAPILVMGMILKENFRKAAENNIRIAVYNKEAVLALTSLKIPLKIHLKIETGTMRQGIYLKDLPAFIQLIKKYPQLTIEAIYSHFANIEDTTNHSFAKKQLRIFQQALKIVHNYKIYPIAHTACSAALILYPETHFDMVRLGLSMYGYWSSPQTFVSAKNLGRQITLKPALTWKTRIAQIKTVKANTPIGYGLTEKVSRNTKIAVLPVGYWDGYDRKLSSIGNVLISGIRCKVIGRVCMNMMMVDINHLNNVFLEDEAILLGKQGKETITVEEIAQKAGTINYEIITRINPLIPRIYK